MQASARGALPAPSNPDDQQHQDVARTPDDADIAAIGAPTPLDEESELGPGQYVFLMVLVVVGVLTGIAVANHSLTPLIYQEPAQAEVARTLHNGQNYALYDLNFEIRGVRRHQIRLMTKTPELIILGASHWQEAHAGLVPGVDFFNAHVHRDYYDDPIGMVGHLLDYNRLPKTLVISVRDATFTPVAERTDYLWLGGIPSFRAMEPRLGLPKRPWYEDYHLQPVLDLFSLRLAITGGLRELRAQNWPGPTDADFAEDLDIFMADGSIRWSGEHLAAFTPEYVRDRALEMAQHVRRHPPRINTDTVDAFRRMLALLQNHDVDVVLAHPPFNPQFHDAVAGSGYADHLQAVEALTRDLAAQYGARTAGSFDPARVGCTADMYIDSEHSRPVCLQKLLAQVVSGRAQAPSL